MEPIINSQLPEFKVQAFHNGEFKTVSNEDVKGKWAIFFFFPMQTLPSFARPNWLTWQRNTNNSKPWE